MNAFRLSIIFIVCVKGAGATDTFKCRIDPSPVLEGEPASITCLFPSDVSMTNFSVNVFKTVNGIRTKEHVLSLSVDHGDKSPFNPQFIKRGYRISGRISNEMRIIVDDATMEHAGNYSCQLNGAAPDEVKWCNLQVTEQTTESSCDVHPVRVGENATLVCHFSKNLLLGRRQLVLQRRSKLGVVLEPVVDCAKEADAEYTCHYNRSQYYIDTAEVKSSTLSVLILNVSKASEGQYSCKLLSSASERPAVCTFKLSETMEPSGEDGAKHDHRYPFHFTVSVIALILSVVAIVLVIFVLVYMFRDRMCQSIGKSKPKSTDKCHTADARTSHPSSECSQHSADNESASVHLATDAARGPETSAEIHEMKPFIA